MTGELLGRLLDAVRDPADGTPRFGTARFSGATFSGSADFTRAEFRSAWFDEARFAGGVRFNGARFPDDARFAEAVFEDAADFRGTVFGKDANFGKASFAAGAWFDQAAFGDGASFTRASFGGSSRFSKARFGKGATFSKAVFEASADFGKAEFGLEARFTGALFAAEARFTEATFALHAWFNRTVFRDATAFGPLACAGTLDLNSAVFTAPVAMAAAAGRVTCKGTRWEAKASLRLRYATVDLTNATFEYPFTVSARATPFFSAGETLLAGKNPGVAVASLSGVDASYLTLTDVDLSACRLLGTIHLDQLRLEGHFQLDFAPRGLRRRGWLPVRWTRRRTLAEEHHWRASRGAAGWAAGPPGQPPAGPTALAPAYRQLRKAFEDDKNEPDAADFYYGEMEMRRHDPTRPFMERVLLFLYWAVSGYGLRALRAVCCLLAAATVTALALMLWGLPKDSPKQETVGAISGRKISAVTDTQDPVDPTGPWRGRLTGERFEKALRVTVNSVVFRSSEEELTVCGTYTEMASRVAEPLLLALAVLAVRGRIKR
ncbi:pentapeptide repeat-containing protein [Streptomyces sp. LaPpAH-108]|uniref:pentapeptide repeat-containing protein n=1 Tax=Streptomyces sp. LaPpAH-108 TaxID=1155714 RepID=UPI002D21CD7B|nr:pentapeptide repeat-containing protein [Streptomyces sp. LaPpAH-108]